MAAKIAKQKIELFSSEIDEQKAELSDLLDVLRSFADALDEAKSRGWQPPSNLVKKRVQALMDTLSEAEDLYSQFLDPNTTARAAVSARMLLPTWKFQLSEAQLQPIINALEPPAYYYYY